MHGTISKVFCFLLFFSRFCALTQPRFGVEKAAICIEQPGIVVRYFFTRFETYEHGHELSHESVCAHMTISTFLYVLHLQGASLCLVLMAHKAFGFKFSRVYLACTEFMAPAQSKPAKATEKKAKKDKKDKKDKVEKPTKGEATSKGAKEVAVPVIVSKKRDQASPSSTTASSASAPSKRLSGKQPVTFVYGTPPGHSTNAVNSPQAASVKATDVDQSKNKKDKKEKKEKNGKKDKKEKGEKPEKPEKTGNAEKVDEPTEKQKKSKAAQNEQGLALVPVPVKRATPPEAKEPEEPETKKRKPAIRKHDAEFQKLLDALEDTSKDIPTDDQSDGHDEEDNQSDQDDEETLVLGASEYGDPSSSTSEGSNVDEEDEEDDDDEQEEEDDENNEEEEEGDEEEEDDEDEEQEAPEPKMSSSVKGKAITAAAAAGCEVAKKANSAFTLFTMINTMNQ